MSFKQKIWSVSFAAPSALADSMAATLDETALAVTILAQPRKAEAQIEGLYNAEPDIAPLTAPLAVVAMLNKTKTPKLTIKEMPKLDWLKKVAEDFPPLRISRWTIHGAQHRNKVLHRRYALQIDATNAFGTGEHPTTRGCLTMLDRLSKAGMKVDGMLDMGCGTGILAMTAAQLYGGESVAVDLDMDSVVIAKNNATSNGLRKNIRIGKSRGYNSRLVHAGAPYDLIMANIFAGPLCHMAYDLKKHLRPGGTVIVAGLLNYQANKVLAAHRLQNLFLVKRLVIGEWSILCLKRSNKA
jgi:ribosomal protein L11 methyltransferase